MSSQETNKIMSVYDEILGHLHEGCNQIYGPRLESLIVFGSVGRGMMKPESDIDLLVIADPLPRGRIPRVQEFQSVEEIMHSVLAHVADTYGVSTYLSPVLKTPREVQCGSPLFLDMLDDARVLFDRDRFFQNEMDRLRARLDRLGARRIWEGDHWYWDLKPDYRVGEVFAL